MLIDKRKNLLFLSFSHHVGFIMEEKVVSALIRFVTYAFQDPPLCIVATKKTWSSWLIFIPCVSSSSQLQKQLFMSPGASSSTFFKGRALEIYLGVPKVYIKSLP